MARFILGSIKTGVKFSVLAASACFILAVPTPGQAFPVLYSANGHYYEIINGNISWQNAKTAAEGLSYLGNPGHLATINSADENLFLTTTFAGNVALKMIGGFQPAGSGEPADAWSWVTGEPFSFTNWNAGEPNDGFGGGEDFLAYWVTSNLAGMTWNDITGASEPGYVVEYATYRNDTVIPEPSTLLLFTAGLAGFAATSAYRRKRK